MIILSNTPIALLEFSLCGNNILVSPYNVMVQSKYYGGNLLNVYETINTILSFYAICLC
jgi:hypothetical protein